MCQNKQALSHDGTCWEVLCVALSEDEHILQLAAVKIVIWAAWSWIMASCNFIYLTGSKTYANCEYYVGFGSTQSHCYPKATIMASSFPHDYGWLKYHLVYYLKKLGGDHLNYSNSIRILEKDGSVGPYHPPCKFPNSEFIWYKL